MYFTPLYIYLIYTLFFPIISKSIKFIKLTSIYHVKTGIKIAKLSCEKICVYLQSNLSKLIIHELILYAKHRNI